MKNSLVGLDQQTFNTIVEYLMQRPYKEVHQILSGLQSNTRIVEIEEQDGEDDD
jgi:hypothetical protein